MKHVLVTSLVDVERTANNRVHYFIEELAQDFQVTVICPKDNWREKQVDVYKYSRQSLNEADIEIKNLSLGSASPFLQDPLSPVLVPQLDIDWDSINIHLDYNTLFLGLSVERHLDDEVHSIYDIADDLPDMIRNSPQIPSGLDYIGGLVGERVMKRKIAKYDRYTYITSGIADNFDLPKEGSFRLPNGVDTEKFRPGVETTYTVPDTEYTIGYVGVNREWVELERLLYAVKEGRERGYDIGALIVGDEGGIDEIKSIATDLHIDEYVVFTGTVPYSEVPGLINAMDIGTIPFDTSGIAENSLPLKLFEYLACGVPVISTEIPGVTEAAGDIVEISRTNSQWFKSMENLISEKNERIAMNDGKIRLAEGSRAFRGRRLVTVGYSWDSVTDELLQIIN